MSAALFVVALAALVQIIAAIPLTQNGDGIPNLQGPATVGYTNSAADCGQTEFDIFNIASVGTPSQDLFQYLSFNGGLGVNFAGAYTFVLPTTIFGGGIVFEIVLTTMQGYFAGAGITHGPFNASVDSITVTLNDIVIEQQYSSFGNNFTFVDGFNGTGFTPAINELNVSIVQTFPAQGGLDTLSQCSVLYTLMITNPNLFTGLLTRRSQHQHNDIINTGEYGHHRSVGAISSLYLTSTSISYSLTLSSPIYGKSIILGLNFSAALINILPFINFTVSLNGNLNTDIYGNTVIYSNQYGNANFDIEIDDFIGRGLLPWQNIIVISITAAGCDFDYTLLINNPTGARPIMSTLLAHYSYDIDYSDSTGYYGGFPISNVSGNSTSGAPSIQSNLYRTGGGALYNDGTGVVQLPYIPFQSRNSDSWSIAAWLYLYGDSTILTNQNPHTNPTSYQQCSGTNCFILSGQFFPNITTIYNATSQAYSNLTDSYLLFNFLPDVAAFVPARQWAHVALVSDDTYLPIIFNQGGTVTAPSAASVWVYVNGELVSSTQTAIVAPTTLQSYSIGLFAGYIDEVWIFSAALTRGQVINLMNYNFPTCPLYDTTYCGQNIAQWTFDTGFNDTMGHYNAQVTGNVAYITTTSSVFGGGSAVLSDGQGSININTPLPLFTTIVNNYYSGNLFIYSDVARYEVSHTLNALIKYDELTFVGWVNPVSISSAQGLLSDWATIPTISWRLGGPNAYGKANYVEFCIEYSYYNYNYQNFSAPYCVYSENTVTTNTWQQVAVVLTPNIVSQTSLATFYINGLFDSVISLPAVAYYTNGTLRSWVVGRNLVQQHIARTGTPTQYRLK